MFDDAKLAAAKGTVPFLLTQKSGQSPKLRYLQAPHKTGKTGPIFEVARTFAHVLFNIGFGDAALLETTVDAWANLFELVRPDLIIFDHSPSALVAARGCKARRVILGNSFSNPPDCSPFPDLQPWLPPDPALYQAERIVLENVNHVLGRRGQPPLERLGQLYSEVDEVLLTTLAEFDHYREQRNALTTNSLTPGPSPEGRGEQGRPTPCPPSGGRGEIVYRGPWMPTGGEAPQWPAGNGKRVIGYLKPFQALPQLLTLLGQSECSAIIRVEPCPADLPKRFGGGNLRIETRRLDLRRAIGECDAAILNGTHGSTVLALLAGKPVLQFPIFVEQELNARAVVRLKAGVMGSMKPSPALAAEVQAIVRFDEYADSARQFAAKYARHCPDQQCEAAVARLAELCA